MHSSLKTNYFYGCEQVAILTFFTLVTLYANIIPISLYVSIEVIYATCCSACLLLCLMQTSKLQGIMGRVCFEFHMFVLV